MVINMSTKNSEEYKPGNPIFFALATMGDAISYQSFTFLIFTFYYAVIRIDVGLIALGFILWSLWNSINDPIAGLISDRTKTRWGRRIPFRVGTFIPLSAMMIVLWTPPYWDANLSYLYFLFIIMLFDTIYTTNSLNLTSLFPEMYQTEEERAGANNWRQLFLVAGLLIAFLAPTMVIEDLTGGTEQIKTISQYQVAGFVLAILVFLCYFFGIRKGLKERPEFKEDSQSVPNWKEAFLHTLKNRNFQFFLAANTCNWYVFGLLPTIVPLYAKAILEGIPTFLVGILLGFTFVFAAIFVNFWKYLGKRMKDLKKAWMLSMTVWVVSLIPFFFITNWLIALLSFAFLGVGLAGSLYFKDLIVSDIIDEDEVNTGVRREGAYYGVNAFIMRLAVIAVFVSIAIVFSGFGWANYFLPETVTPAQLSSFQFGLKLLFTPFPAVALLLAIIFISRYDLVGIKLEKVKKQLALLHEQKRAT